MLTQDTSGNIVEKQGEVHTVRFLNHMLREVMADVKQLTVRLWRPGRHLFQEGEVFWADFGNEESGPLPMPCVCTEDCRVVALRDLPASVPMLDGFNDHTSLMLGLRAIHGLPVGLDSQVFVIRFERHFDAS